MKSEIGHLALRVVAGLAAAGAGLLSRPLRSLESVTHASPSLHSARRLSSLPQLSSQKDRSKRIWSALFGRCGVLNGGGTGPPLGEWWQATQYPKCGSLLLSECTTRRDRAAPSLAPRSDVDLPPARDF